MVLLLSDDLLDASKTIACGRAVGVSVLQCRTPAMLLEQLGRNETPCCIVDLHCPGLDIEQLMAAVNEQGKKACVIAYGSHVDAGRLSAARKAGCAEVMPRSQFFDVMPKRIMQWSGAG
jgi:FixJ family two-component response regulator